MLNEQSLMPEQPDAEPVPPVQPVKTAPSIAAPERVIDAPWLTMHAPVSPAQSSVQPDAVTSPDPAPDLVMIRACCIELNVAVQFLYVSMVARPSEQSSSPLQPANVEPAEGAAARVTSVPALYLSSQSVPQLIPAGLLVTVPEPVPDLVIFSAGKEFRAANKSILRCG